MKLYENENELCRNFCPNLYDMIQFIAKNNYVYMQYCNENRPYMIHFYLLFIGCTVQLVVNWYDEDNTINHITILGFLWILAIVDIFFQIDFHLFYSSGS